MRATILGVRVIHSTSRPLWTWSHWCNIEIKNERNEQEKAGRQVFDVWETSTTLTKPNSNNNLGQTTMKRLSKTLTVSLWIVRAGRLSGWKGDRYIRLIQLFGSTSRWPQLLPSHYICRQTEPNYNFWNQLNLSASLVNIPPLQKPRARRTTFE